MSHILIGSLSLLFLSILSCTHRHEGISIKFPDGRVESLKLRETLRLDWSYRTLNWQENDNRLLDNLMEGLLQWDFSQGEPRLAPGLATRWTAIEGGRKWTLEVRQNVVWTDGVPFRAEQIVDAWQRALDPKTASNTAYFLFPIKNARAFNAGQVPFGKVGVGVRDGHRLEIELEKPTVFFPYLLTNSATYPIRKDLIANFGETWAKPENLVTLGPYRVVTEEPERLLYLTRHDHYWDAERFKASPKNVIVNLAAEDASVNLFEAGQLDLVPWVPSNLVRSISKDTESRFGPMQSVYYLAFATSKAPVDSPLIRRAFALAIDRNDVIKVRAGHQRLLSGWVPEKMLGHRADGGLGFSVEEAKKLLAQAGHPGGEGIPPIELAIYQEDDRASAENIQYQLKKNLGVHVDIHFEEWKTLFPRFKTNPPAMHLNGWDLDFPDPHNVFDLLTSNSGNNRTQWKNPTYDRLIDRATGTFDPKARAKLYREAEDLLLKKEVPVVPLYSSDRTYLVAPRVAKYPINPFGKIIFKDIELRDR